MAMQWRDKIKGEVYVLDNTIQKGWAVYEGEISIFDHWVEVEEEGKRILFPAAAVLKILRSS